MFCVRRGKALHKSGETTRTGGGARDMAQGLKVYTAFIEDPNSTHVRWLTYLTSFFWLLWTPALVCTHLTTHTYKQLKITIEKCA